MNPRRVSDIRCTRGLSAEELVFAGHVLWCVASLEVSRKSLIHEYLDPNAKTLNDYFVYSIYM